MNKNISCQYSYDELTRVMAAAPITNHKKALISSFLLMCSGFIFFAISAVLDNDSVIRISSIIILVLSSLAMGLNIINIPSIKERVFYNKTKKSNLIFKDGLINEYTFLDDHIELKSKFGTSESSINIAYSTIMKVSVYKGNIYLFVNATSCYICKELFNDEEFNEFLNKLQPKVKKSALIL